MTAVQIDLAEFLACQELAALRASDVEELSAQEAEELLVLRFRALLRRGLCPREALLRAVSL
jgi:hypothetical protein